MSESTVYCVFKQGVYRHECLGVFNKVHLAKSTAKKAASKEEDDYHDFEVVEFEMNETGFDEDVIYSARKGATDD